MLLSIEIFIFQAYIYILSICKDNNLLYIISKIINLLIKLNSI